MNLLSKYRAIFIAACLAVISLTPAAHAQQGESIARIQVPFAFDCGARHYPAGLYNIRKWGEDLLMINGSSSGLAMTQTDANARPTKIGEVVFRVVGHRHFLHEIRSGGDTTIFVFYPSRAEQKIELAANAIHQPDIQLALLNAPR